MTEDNRLYLIICRLILAVCVLITVMILAPVFINLPNTPLVLFGIALFFGGMVLATIILVTSKLDAIYLTIADRPVKKGDLS